MYFCPTLIGSATPASLTPRGSSSLLSNLIFPFLSFSAPRVAAVAASSATLQNTKGKQRARERVSNRSSTKRKREEGMEASCLNTDAGYHVLRTTRRDVAPPPRFSRATGKHKSACAVETNRSGKGVYYLHARRLSTPLVGCGSGICAVGTEGGQADVGIQDDGGIRQYTEQHTLPSIR